MTFKKDNEFTELAPLTTLDIDSLINLKDLQIDNSFLNLGSTSNSTYSYPYGPITPLPLGTVNITSAPSTALNPYSIQQNNLIFHDFNNKTKVNLDTSGISMDSDCDIKIGNFSLKESLERIEKQLAILHVNPELEKEWEELKELGERYRELEKNIHEKINVWKILKNE